MKGYDCIDGTCPCRYCHVTQPCAEFIINGATPRGHTLQCRTCNTKARHIKLGSKPQKHLPDRNCPWCGITFHGDHARAKYCSEACHYAARSKPETCSVHYFTCPWCKNLYTSQRAGRKYCSSECAWRTLYPRYLVQPRSNRCIDCGAEYTQTHGRNQRCAPCVNMRAEAIHQRSKALRRQRQRTNGPSEVISRQFIYERDNWTCYLCGTSVDRHSSPLDPLYPTLDHVMPLALGGTHTADNLRLACRACNMAKGASFLVPPPTTPQRRKKSRVGP
jgi:hypothetical protein